MRKFRIGIIYIDGEQLQKWQTEYIQQFQSRSEVELFFISVTTGKEEHVGDKSTIWNIYHRYKIFKKSTYFDQLNDFHISSSVKGSVEKEDNFFKFSLSTVNDLKSLNLDFLINFSYLNILAKNLPLPFGIWDFSVDDINSVTTLRSGLKEYITGEYSRTFELSANYFEGGNYSLKLGRLQLCRHSFVKSMEKVLDECNSWINDVLTKIEKDNIINLTFFLKKENKELTTFKPNAYNVFISLIRNTYEYVKDFILFNFCEEKWGVGIAKADNSELLKLNKFKNIRWITDFGHSSFVADPFPLPGKENITIIAEGYSEEVSSGHLLTIDYNSDSGFSTPEKVLDRDHHLSYPFTFTHDGIHYLIPEEGETNKVTLYKIKRDPFELEKVSVLIDNFSAVDATLLYYQGRWWIFCTHRERKPLSELHIYFADTFSGTYMAHPKNPVKSDISSSRPGGSPFEINGKLYRVSQDCQKTYGGSVSINEIVTLTPTDFKELVVNRIYPSKSEPYRSGLHTISRVDEKTVLIDGKVFIFRFELLKNFIKNNIIRHGVNK